MATKYFLDKAGLKRYDTKVKAVISEIVDKVSALNGDSTEDGSVKNIVATEIAKIVDEAPESLDTLKEIADWISSHSESASAMNTQISENKSGILSLENAVKTLENSQNTTENDLESVKNSYSTKEEVSELSSVFVSRTDADSTYATKEELDSYAKETEISGLADVYLKQTDAATNYAKKTDLSSYAKQTDIDTIKTDYVKKSEVVDSLTNTATTLPLSANQGKVLDEKISDVESKLCKVYDPVNEITYTLAVENGLLYLDDGKD